MIKDKRKRKTAPLTPEERTEKNQLQRMKERAAFLSIAPLGGGLYQVWGGEDTHIVTETMGWLTCDCRGWGAARHHNCSHVMKYRLVFGDLKK